MNNNYSSSRDLTNISAKMFLSSNVGLQNKLLYFTHLIFGSRYFKGLG